MADGHFWPSLTFLFHLGLLCEIGLDLHPLMMEEGSNGTLYVAIHGITVSTDSGFRLYLTYFYTMLEYKLQIDTNVLFWLDKAVRRLSHVRTVMFC